MNFFMETTLKMANLGAMGSPPQALNTETCWIQCKRNP